jgi:DNA mismatch repair protein MutL
MNNRDEEYTMLSSSTNITNLGGGSSIVEYIDDEVNDTQSTFGYFDTHEEGVFKPSFDDVLTLPTGFAIALYGGKCVLVSLRRAKERIIYEDVLRSLSIGKAPSQRMFFAEELTLSSEEATLMEEHATEFAALGFEVEYKGEGHILVSGRPATLDMAIPLDELIYELLHGIDAGELPIEQERERLATLMARRGSAGYGRGLRNEEAKALLNRLAECQNISFTASGLQIMAELTKEEMEAKLTKR